MRVLLLQKGLKRGTLFVVAEEDGYSLDLRGRGFYSRRSRGIGMGEGDAHIEMVPYVAERFSVMVFFKCTVLLRIN